MMKFSNIICNLSIAFLLISCEQLPAQQLSAKQFSDAIDTAKNMIILDVRTPSEFSDGHIKNAVNIDFRNADFGQSTDVIDKSKAIYIYCLTGVRSSKAASQLRSSGYTVYELNGGMLKWRALDLPEQKPAMSNSQGMTLDDYALIIKSHPKVLIDFYAEWCGPCKLMEPYIKEIGNTEKTGIKVVRVDVDKNPELAAALKIDALPVLHYYKNADMKWGYVGYLSKKALLNKLKD